MNDACARSVFIREIGCCSSTLSDILLGCHILDEAGDHNIENIYLFLTS